MDSECFVCGISEQRARLLDAISSSGIVKICEKCSEKEGIPVMKRPTSQQLKDSEKENQTVKKAFVQSSQVIKEAKEKEATETTLRDIVDRNYLDKAPKGLRPRPDLVDHFHWAIMRARRAKKLTQEQLAHEISESLAAIKMAEQGILPEDDYKLVNKLESFLGIKLIKGVPGVMESSDKPPKRIEFDPETTKDLTIDDLRKMRDSGEDKEDLFEEVRKKMMEEELGEEKEEENSG